MDKTGLGHNQDALEKQDQYDVCYIENLYNIKKGTYWVGLQDWWAGHHTEALSML
jgi:hypothetical protein